MNFSAVRKSDREVGPRFEISDQPCFEQFPSPVPFSAVTTLSICLSSAAFGLMHGQQWILGTLAGLAYAGVVKQKGRLSDAVVAHATSNFLLAIWVLSRGDWSQW